MSWPFTFCAVGCLKVRHIKMNDHKIIGKIAVLINDTADEEALRLIIEGGPYQMVTCSTLEELKTALRIQTDCWLAAILDLDSVPLDNRTIRKLAVSFPPVFFFGTSRNRYHPEFKDAICYHLYACLKKPVDPDELHFFLKGISDESPGSGEPSDY
jgi:hypothetical protein